MAVRHGEVVDLLVADGLAERVNPLDLDASLGQRSSLGIAGDPGRNLRVVRKGEIFNIVAVFGNIVVEVAGEGRLGS